MCGGSLNRSDINFRAQDRRRSPWAKWLGVLPLLVALLTLVLLNRASITSVFRVPNFPGQYFNIVLLGGASFVVAYLAWRGFSLSGQTQLLLFGGGVLSLGMAMVLGSAMFLLFGQGNVGTTIYGVEALLSGILFLIGAAVGVSGGLFKPQVHRKRLAFGVYAAVLLMPMVVWALSAADVIPVFYVPGQGVTLIRKVALDTTLSLFVIAGLADLWLDRKTRGSFLYRYGMGLLLLALGLFAWQFIRVSDDSFTWLGRAAQYVGAAYFVIAAVSALREATVRHVPVGEVMAAFFRQTKGNYKRAVENTDTVIGAKPSGMTVARWVGAAVPLILLLLLVFSKAVDTDFVYYPIITFWGTDRSLFSVFNIIFVVLISFVVAYIAARGYMATAQPQLAWLGGSTLALAFSGLLVVTVPTNPTSLNVAATLNNTGSLLASILCLVSALTVSRNHSLHSQPKVQGWFLTSIYGVSVLLLLTIFVTSLRGIMPAFWIAGVGSTLLRWVVVNSAVAFFAISGILLMVFYFRNRATFIYWYSLALILIALGLSMVGFVKSPGDVFAWLGRGSQYIGGIYLAIAVVTVVSEAHAKQKSIEETIAEFGRQTKVNYELLVNSASDAIIAVDGLGRILTWNPAAEKMFGYTQKEAIGIPFFNLLLESAGSYQKVSDAFTPETDAAGAPVTMELKAKRKNGEEFPVSLTLARKETMAGWLPTTTTLIIRDITEHKKAEEKVQQVIRQWRDTFDAIPALISIHDSDYNIVRVNIAFCKAFGMKTEQLVGKKCYEVFHKTTKPIPACPHCKTIETGQITREEIFEPTQNAYFDISTAPIFNADGKVTNTVHIARDVTERKKAEVRLMESERRLAEAQHTAHIGSWEWDLKTGEMHWSDEMFRIVGAEPQSFIPTLESAVERMHPDDRQKVEEQLSELWARGTAGYEHRIVLPDGSIRDVSTYSIVTYDDSKKPVSMTGTLQDITERKKAERMKDEFIGLVSHELRTPLTVVIGSLRTAISEGVSQEDYQELLRNAVEGADSLNAMLENMLELSRYQVGRLQLYLEPVSIANVARNVMERLKNQGVRHKFLADIPLDLPQVKADPMRVERILYNLVENAAKYSPEGSEIKVSSRREGGFVVTSVIDRGSGIAPENTHKLFQLFQRLDASALAKGAGLGLVVCQRLVEVQDGWIKADSELGKGSTFSFALPEYRAAK